MCLLWYDCLQYGLPNFASKIWLGLSFSAHHTRAGWGHFVICVKNDLACHLMSQSMSCLLALCQKVKLSRDLGMRRSILFFPQVCLYFIPFSSFQRIRDHGVRWRKFLCKSSCLWGHCGLEYCMSTFSVSILSHCVPRAVSSRNSASSGTWCQCDVFVHLMDWWTLKWSGPVGGIGCLFCSLASIQWNCVRRYTVFSRSLAGSSTHWTFSFSLQIPVGLTWAMHVLALQMIRKSPVFACASCQGALAVLNTSPWVYWAHRLLLENTLITEKAAEEPSHGRHIEGDELSYVPYS